MTILQPLCLHVKHRDYSPMFIPPGAPRLPLAGPQANPVGQRPQLVRASVLSSAGRREAAGLMLLYFAHVTTPSPDLCLRPGLGAPPATSRYSRADSTFP